jgi:hypothetical protein
MLTKICYNFPTDFNNFNTNKTDKIIKLFFDNNKPISRSLIFINYNQICGPLIKLFLEISSNYQYKLNYR